MNKTVLFLDDNVLRLRVEIEALQDGGWQVLEAEKMHEAINYLETTNVDVLILDIIMPFDEKVHLEEEDWAGIPMEPSRSGVAFYRYLQRKNLLETTSVVIYTNQSRADLERIFPKGSGLLLLDKFDLWPDELAEQLDALKQQQAGSGGEQ